MASDTFQDQWGGHIPSLYVKSYFSESPLERLMKSFEHAFWTFVLFGHTREEVERFLSKALENRIISNHNRIDMLYREYKCYPDGTSNPQGYYEKIPLSDAHVEAYVEFLKPNFSIRNYQWFFNQHEINADSISSLIDQVEQNLFIKTKRIPEYALKDYFIEQYGQYLGNSMYFLYDHDPYAVYFHEFKRDVFEKHTLSPCWAWLRQCRQKESEYHNRPLFFEIQNSGGIVL